MVDKFEALAMQILTESSTEKNSVALKMIKHISKYYRKKEEPEKSKKITLTLSLWIEMSKKEEFKKYSTVAHVLCKKLKDKRIVSAQSVLYPRNIKFISANPLSSAFVHAKFEHYDKVLQFRDDILKKLKDNLCSSEERLHYLFMYIHVFHLERMPLKYFKELRQENIVTIPTRTLLIFCQKTITDFKPIDIFMLDKAVSAILHSFMKDTPNPFEKIDCDKLGKKVRNKLNQEFPMLSISELRKIIQLEFQLERSSLSLALMTAKHYPRLQLHEIEYLHEGSIKEELLEIENKNISIYRDNFSKKDDEEDVPSENSDINTYLFQNIETYDTLKLCKKVPYGKKEFQKYLKKWYTFINKAKKKEKNGFLLQILEFTELLINKADEENLREIHSGKKPIKPKTLKEYLRIAFDFAFKHIVVEGNINAEIIRSIEVGIIYNDNLVLATQRKYKRIINIFIKNMTEFDTLEKIQSTIYVNRSFVFEKEVDILIKTLQSMYKVGKSENARYNFIASNQRAIFALLLYYSGARKNELRTRLTRDIIAIGRNEFSLDINEDGVKKQKLNEGDDGKGMKTVSTKRRVRFEVTNKNHLELIHTYVKFIEEHNTLFLFPEVKRKIHENKIKYNKVYKKKIMPEARLSKISQLLQEITGRYTPLHTLRHSYATNKVEYMYDVEDMDTTFMFELAEQIGHKSPEVTIESYVHLGILKLTLDVFDI
jgi:integrase